MNLDLTPEQSAFRDEVRAFFAENVPESFKSRVRAGMRLEPHEFTQWQKLLHARGWGAPSWPKEYGGTGWDPTQLYIFETEASRADAPVQFHQGLELIGPIIFTFGSPEQKAKYLPAIVSGDDWWCQGYSEPNSGSDLASLSTTQTLFGLPTAGDCRNADGSRSACQNYVLEITNRTSLAADPERPEVLISGSSASDG